MQKSQIFLTLMVLFLTLTAQIECPKDEDPVPVALNFDELASGTKLSDQYLAQGVRFVGKEESAGIIGKHPEYGVYAYGNSQPNFSLIGAVNGPGIHIEFVTKEGEPRASSSVSIRVGDGDSSNEKVLIKAFNLSGSEIASEEITTVTTGEVVSFSSGDIAKITLQSLPAQSGITFDDLSFFGYAPEED